MLIESPEQPRRPGTVRLKESDPKRRKALQDTARREAHQGLHGRDGVREGMDLHPGTELAAGLAGPQLWGPGRVEADGDPEILAFRPERVVIRVIPPAALVDVG